MNIEEQTLTVKDHPDLKMKMLNWANRFNIFCLPDSNKHSPGTDSFECLLAAGCKRSFSFPDHNAFEEFFSFFESAPSWLFGHLSYNAAGNAYVSDKVCHIDFGKGFFFEPEIILQLKAGVLRVLKADRDPFAVLQEIRDTSSEPGQGSVAAVIRPDLSRNKYIEKIKEIKAHIRRGDCYELNFCQQFRSADAAMNPVSVYGELSKISAAPFAAFYKLGDKYCLCASPERFLKKTGNLLISQPIKGTIRRESSPEADELAKQKLAGSAKEKAENVMIVDLVRNDLSIVCERASVKVSELFGVHSFPQVHHLVSTVEGTLRKDKTFTDAIEACYPMGSMTGAPKKRVMELIEDFESEDRGLFSGSIGYITPAGDLDLNVVIRSIFYDKKEKKLSLFAGSGITFNSDPAAEYDECLAKAEALINILTAKKAVAARPL